MQKMMLEECLRLQINKDSGKREFRVREDMVQKASRMMKECGLIARPVSYKELMGL
jgi:NitT/TauT family transport system substrate-binding protein